MIWTGMTKILLFYSGKCLRRSADVRPLKDQYNRRRAGRQVEALQIPEKELVQVDTGQFAESNDIYRTGIAGQFNLTFELAWKALWEVLRLHGAAEAGTGLPREIPQLGYKFGFPEEARKDREGSASGTV